MENRKWLITSIMICSFFPACIYTNPNPKSTPKVNPTSSADCNYEAKQMRTLIEGLHNQANSLDIKNKELTEQNNYLKNKVSQTQLEVLKRDAVIQIQGNVIKLLDDADKTIETGLKDEIEDKIKELEETRKNQKWVFYIDDLFKPKTLTMTDKAQQQLLALADTIKNNKTQTIFVEGHTDNIPVSPSQQKQYPSNWEVSFARAAAVARFLQTQAGIDPGRLVVIGHGAFKPIASNKTGEGRGKNRRVEIYLGPPI